MLVLKRIWPSLLLLVFTVAFAASGALAGNIANVSTGLNASYGLITTAGATDAHWTYDDDGTIGAAAILTDAGGCSNGTNNWYCDWLPDQTNSSWIGKSAGYGNGSDLYTFSTTFNLTGYNLSTVALSGWFTADDAGSLFLNGNLISTTSICEYQATCSSWDMMNFFSVPKADFISGLNTLSITLTYNDDNWEGVQLSGEVTGSPISSTTPEPASLLLLGTGLLGMVPFLRGRLGR